MRFAFLKFFKSKKLYFLFVEEYKNVLNLFLDNLVRFVKAIPEIEEAPNK